MGNQIHKFCYSRENPDKQLHMTTLPLATADLLIPLKDTYTQENVIAIQKAVRKKISMNVVKSEEQQKSKKFDECFIPIHGDYVSQNEIEKRWTDADLFLKKEKGEFTYDEGYGGPLHPEFLLSFTKGPICLKNTDSDIYQGTWKWNNLCENSTSNSDVNEFYRSGLGCLYKSSGIKVEAIWNEDNPSKNGRIYYPNGSIFIGEITMDQRRNYLPHGRGTMYYPKPSCISFMKGNWLNGIADGRFNLVIPNEFTLEESFFLGKVDTTRGKFLYCNGSVYEGGFIIKNGKYFRNGFGTMTYLSGVKYEGMWKFDKYNGKGLLFVPSSDTYAQETSPVEGLEMKFGDGTYTAATWINGLLIGHGTIYTKRNIVKGLFRFGKTILKLENITKTKTKKIQFYYNRIFSFLTPMELLPFLQLKCSYAFRFFKKNHFENLLKVKLYQLCMHDSKSYTEPIIQRRRSSETKLKTNPVIHFLPSNVNVPINPFLVDRISLISNIEDIFTNCEVNKFIPIVGYCTTGGVSEMRFHYSNLFSPKIDSGYLSHYLLGIVNDIEVRGVLNAEMYEHVNVQKESRKIGQINDSPDLIKEIIKSLFQKGVLFHNNLPIEKNQMVTYDSNNATDYHKEEEENYINLYNKSFKEYQFDYTKENLFDTQILSNAMNTNEAYFFAAHQIIVQVPIKMSLYTILTNPVRTLAIYLHDSESDCGSMVPAAPAMKRKDSGQMIINTTLQEFTISSSFLQFYEDLGEQINFDRLVSKLSSLKIPIMKIVSQSNFRSIEFDTLAQSQMNFKKRLLCLLFIKEYNSPIVINLKRFYHLGKLITVKLIDQNVLYNSKRVGIDVGSVCLYGSVFHLK